MDDWRVYAACRGMDSNLFYPQSGQMPRDEAIDACGKCEVSDECLAYAIKYEDRGFWAGTTGSERASLREALQITLERRPYQIWPRDPCGTYGGYQRHRRAGEEACAICKDANARRTEFWEDRPPGERHGKKRDEANGHQADQDGPATLL
jgi:WhiB family redox-sensing transcriptional regulator